MGLGSTVKAIWVLLQGTTNPNVTSLINNLYQKLEGAKAGYGSVGNIFFVHGFTGLDTNDGLTPATPFLTITHALTQCANDHDDYIIVLEHWQEVVAINVTRVHIIGATKNPTQAFVQMNAAADTPIFTVTALSNHCEIAGFSFGGGATHAGIENVAGTPMHLHIHDCMFGHSFAGDTPQDGIRIGVNATNLRVENCIFLGVDAEGGGTLTRDGIRFTSGGIPLGGSFKGNIFTGIPGVAINIVQVAANSGGFIIEDNRFMAEIADAQAAGWAITLQGPGTVKGCLIAHNFASQTGDDTGNNPYRDLSTGVLATCLNGWVANYAGNVLSPGPAVA